MIKKKYMSILLGVLLSMMIFNISAYAQPRIITDINTESERLPSTIKESRDYVKAVLRGVFFSAADLKIFNSNGEIGVSAHAFMSDPIDELYMTIYVDCWSEKENRWTQVTYYDFEFYAKDYPNGLTSETVEFIIDNQPKGKHYRLRGSYMAIKDGAMEGFGPVTDGVLIE